MRMVGMFLLAGFCSSVVSGQERPYFQASAGLPAIIHPAILGRAAETATRLRVESRELYDLLLEATPLPGLFDRELFQYSQQVIGLTAEIEALLLTVPVFAQPLQCAIGQLDGAVSRVGSGLRRRLLSRAIESKWACFGRTLESLYCSFRRPLSPAPIYTHGSWPAPWIQGNPVWWNTGAFATIR